MLMKQQKMRKMRKKPINYGMKRTLCVGVDKTDEKKVEENVEVADPNQNDEPIVVDENHG